MICFEQIWKNARSVCVPSAGFKWHFCGEERRSNAKTFPDSFKQENNYENTVLVEGHFVVLLWPGRTTSRILLKEVVAASFYGPLRSGRKCCQKSDDTETSEKSWLCSGKQTCSNSSLTTWWHISVWFRNDKSQGNLKQNQLQLCLRSTDLLILRSEGMLWSHSLMITYPHLDMKLLLNVNTYIYA